MTTVLAALDSSLAGNPVLITSRALARMLGARVNAINVVTNGDDSVRNVAEAAGVPLQVASGPVVESLVEAGRAEDVVALIIGARATPSGRRPLGSTAFAVATSLAKPVVVVPPVGRIAPELRRVLVPLEGTASTALAPRSLVEVARGANLDVIVLHVHEEEVIPAFTDQPQHEHEAWAREFLSRYCPWGIGAVRLERRRRRRSGL
jgi:nucleotide-binding universal stress UspA family protein